MRSWPSDADDIGDDGGLDDPTWAAPAGVVAGAHQRDVVSGPAAGRTRSLRWISVALVVAALVTVGAIKFVPPFRRSSAAPPGGSTTTNSGSTNPDPVSGPSSVPAQEPPSSPAGPPSPAADGPTAVGAVSIDPLAVTDGRTGEIAAMLDTYFTGVNNRDVNAALSVFDPTGVINPNDPAQVSSFARAISTTVDSGAVLRFVGADPTGKGAAQAEVTFRSQQGSGYGPKTNPNEVCTVWDVTYVLTQPDPDTYRILSSTATHQSC